MDKKIILKPHWDYQPKIGNEFGHHVTRESENRILLDFISRRKEGSMLICGHRGVGKTSSVFKATNEAISKNNKIKPVLIKATSINFDDEDTKKNTLRSFIRSLYNRVKDDPDIDGDLKTKTSELYNKAIASQVKNENILENKISREKTSRIHINLIAALSIISVGVLFLIGTFSDYSWIFSDYSWILSDYSWIFSIVTFVSGTWLLIDYSKVVKKSSTNLASHYYRYDYDFSTMQSEFESLLEDFVKKEFKILFILDELDKVGDNSFDIISNLKMLINQGNGLFIFITDPKFLPQIKDMAKPLSTLFSQILFLKRPLFDEMRTFLTEIIMNSEKLITNTDYKNFQNFLCYQSKTSFFDLYNVIRDNISETDVEGPLLSLNLDADKITKANLQKSIEWIYERKKFSAPSKWEENDKMLDTLYNICGQLEDTPKLQNIVIENSTFKFPKSSVDLTNPKLHSSATDLFTFLTSQGYLQKTAENTFQIIGQLMTINETKGGIFVEEQSTFVKEYEHMIELAINMANLHNHYVQNLGKIFSLDNINSKWNPFTTCVSVYFNITTLEEHRTIYFDLIGNDPTVYPSEKLQQMTIELQNGYDGIKKGFLTLLIQIFNKKIDGLTAGLTIGDISRGVLTASKIQNTNFLHGELSYDDMGKNRLQHIVISQNIPIDFLEKLLNVTNLNLLIVSFGDSEDNSKYDGVSSALSIETLPEGLNELPELDGESKQYIFLPITLPIQSAELDKLLESL